MIDLRLDNVGLTLPSGRQLFQIREFTLASGSQLLLRGASGTGKSSLLHLLAGLMLPSQGSITADGVLISDLSDSSRARWRRENVGLIFQKLNLLSHLTVSENVALASSAAQSQAQAIHDVGLSELANERASVLSGGEQQRVAVARVLAQPSRLILADEPTSSLDDGNAAFVINALKRASIGRTLIVVSHDDRLASSFSDIRTLESL